MGSDKARPATVQDVDEGTGETVTGTRRRAVTKERPKVHREIRDTRTERRSSRRTQSGDTGYPEQSSSAAQHIEVRERDVKPERRKSSSSTKSPRKSARPPSSHESRPFLKIPIPTTSSRPGPDPSYYGIPTPTTTGTPVTSSMAIPLRPRAQTSQTYLRPLSYHAAQTSSGGYGPPISSSAYFQQPHLITPSYPPPSSYMPYSITPQQQAPQQQQHQLQYSAQPQYSLTSGADYFSSQATSRPLSTRFDLIARTGSAIDPIPRTASAFGTREYPQQRALDTYDAGYYNDTYASDADGPATIRKRDRSIRVPSSASVTSRADRVDREADSIAMPPPRRPSILRRPQTEYTLDAPRQAPFSEYRDSHDTRTHFSDERETRTQFSDEPLFADSILTFSGPRSYDTE